MPNKEASQYRAEDKLADYSFTFSTEQGKRVLCDLYEQCHMGHPTYVRGDQSETAYREGERNIFLRIQYFLRLSSADMDKLLEGNRDE